jgi:glycosyltransferase involved in cell wall biosynthesis
VTPAAPSQGGGGRRRPCHLLVTGTSRIASVELVGVLPFRELARRGICQSVYVDEAKVSGGYLAWADAVLFVRPCSSRAQAVAQVARAVGRRVLSHYDDDLLRLPPGTASEAYYGSGGIRQRLLWFLQQSDQLCFSNPVLAEAYRELTDRPMTVLGVGITCPDLVSKAEDRRRILFAGSLDHGSFVNRICAEALQAAVAEHGAEVELYCLGARPDLVGDLPVEYLPYIDDYDDYRELVASLAPDICLAPLQEGDFFARKFYNKLLDYGSLGAAIIFSDVPPYRGLVRDGEHGLLVANDPAAWRKALLRLIGDQELRLRLGQCARRYVEEHHSVVRAADSYQSALAETLAYRAAPASDAACAVPNRGLFRENLADHGLGRTLRRGMKKFLGI